MVLKLLVLGTGMILGSNDVLNCVRQPETDINKSAAGPAVATGRPLVTRWRDDMWLRAVSVRNFRSIENLPITLDRRANVIVGPNAIGKTTLLEAIRLAKAALAPRTPNEAQQAFIGLGAVSPHNPYSMNYNALARDVARPVEI